MDTSLPVVVRDSLERRALFSGARRVLVACSGGPDSQVLLHVLWTLRAHHGCEVLAASVDHGLRPEASAEMALAAELAHRLGVHFETLRVQVPKGPSVQAQARSARYQALIRCARQHGAERIAVGHTLDDQAETVFARILRGASLEGLRGIVPKRTDGVVRPLIDARRDAVLAYAEKHALSFAQDPSNLDARFLRVRVRRTLLPLLQAENPRIAEQLAALSEDVRDLSIPLRNEVKRAHARFLGMGVAGLMEETGYVRRSVLKLMVEETTGREIHRTHLAALERMLREGGQVRLPGDTIASIDARGQLCFSRVEKRGRGVTRPTHGSD